MDNDKFQLIELSPEDRRDYQLETVLVGDAILPEVYDPRTELLGVRDQGAQGSCVAEATAAMKERQEASDSDFHEYMSPQFIYNLRPNKGIVGMYPRNAMDILRNIGIVPEQEYPYGKIEDLQNAPDSLKGIAKNYSIDSYAYVNTIDGLKRAVQANGACVFCIPVYNFSEIPWRAKTLGQGVLGYHAVAAIGWNKDGFILRNSWGKSWAQSGYTIFPFGDWGMQSEVWTALDNLGSGKDNKDDKDSKNDKYSKWYWKLWRGIVNIHTNAKGIAYLYDAMVVSSVGISIWKQTGVPLVLVGMASLVAIYLVVKDELYLARGSY